MEILPSNKVVDEKIPYDLYKEIINRMPIFCVDSVVYREKAGEREVLMVEREDPPIKGLFCFPGGRLFKNESLEQAVKRKLKTECGLDEDKFEIEHQIGIFHFSSKEGPISNLNGGYHTVAVAYLVKSLEENPLLRLDTTNKSYRWKNVDEFANEVKGLHPYIAEILNDSNVFKKVLRNIDRSYGK